MITPIFNKNKFTLYKNDCNDVLSQLPESFDLIFADPPYLLYFPESFNLMFKSTPHIIHGNVVSVYNNKDSCLLSKKLNKIDEINHMDMFNMNWLKNAKTSLKSTGAILVSGTYHNIFSIGRCLLYLDFKILNIITWKKIDYYADKNTSVVFSMPEQIIFACKNYDYIDKILRNINSNNKELIIETKLTQPWEKTQGNHPTQKPLSLLTRLILMATKDDSIVCDPFSGSSTTGIAANLIGREFIGIEKEQEFIDISIRRKWELDENFDNIKAKVADN